MSNLRLQVSSLRGLPCAAWCPANQGAETPCQAHGIACVGHGGGGAVAPAPVPGSHQQVRPRIPGDLLWGAAGRDRGSVWRVPALAVAPAVVLSLLPYRLTYAVCWADGNGGTRWRDLLPFT